MAALLAGSIFMKSSEVAHAAGGLTLSLFATHPYASQSIYNETSVNYYTGAKLCAPASGETTRTCPVGQNLTDMEISNNGELIVGYGDWATNSDSFGVQPWSRVGVMPLNVATKQWGTMVFAGSEGLDVVRKFDDGTIYVPTADPSDKVASGQTISNRRGFISNASGSWQFTTDGDALEHVFDIAKDNTGHLWMFGTNNPNGIVLRSTDGTTAWETMPPSGTTSAASGFYLNGKVYAQTTGNATSTMIYDTANNTWTDSGVKINMGSLYKLPITLSDRVVVPSADSKLNMYDENLNLIASPKLDGFIEDTTKYNGELYILTSETDLQKQRIYRLDTTTNRVVLIGSFAFENGEAVARTLALHDGYIYVAGKAGKIWRSDTTITQIPALSPVLTGVSPSAVSVADGADGIFYLRGQDFINTSTVKIGNLAATAEYVNEYSVKVTLDAATYRQLLASDNVQSKKFDVTITNSDGLSSTLAQSLTVTLDASLATIVPPESCFSFDSGTNTILAYYEYEGNNVTNSVCPKNVAIPSTIGGVTVTSIGNAAFRNHHITAVKFPDTITTLSSLAFANNDINSATLPNSIVNIDRYAFMNNKLTTVDIPDSVTRIKGESFMNNQLQTVALPDGLTEIDQNAFSGNRLNEITIPAGVRAIDREAFAYQNPKGGDVRAELSSGDTARIQAAYATMYFTRAYLANTTNSNKLSDVIDNVIDMSDYDADGSKAEYVSIGGVLINAVPLTINYQDKAGVTVAPSKTLVGKLLDGTELTSYLVKNAVNEKPYDQYNTSGVYTYNRVGTTVQVSSIKINGYTSQKPTSATLRLSAGQNTHTFVYKKTAGNVKPNNGTTTPSSITTTMMKSSELKLNGAGENSSCQTIANANLVSSDSVKKSLGSKIVLLGGVDFTLECKKGATASITYVLGDTVSDISKMHLYKMVSGRLTDITKSVKMVVNNDNKIAITYSLTDGGQWDDDGKANGLIVDPLYIGADSDIANELASTGRNTWFIVGAAGILVLGGAVVLVVVIRRRRSANHR